MTHAEIRWVVSEVKYALLPGAPPQGRTRWQVRRRGSNQLLPNMSRAKAPLCLRCTGLDCRFLEHCLGFHVDAGILVGLYLEDGGKRFLRNDGNRQNTTVTAVETQVPHAPPVGVLSLYHFSLSDVTVPSSLRDLTQWVNNPAAYTCFVTELSHLINFILCKYINGCSMLLRKVNSLCSYSLSKTESRVVCGCQATRSKKQLIPEETARSTLSWGVVINGPFIESSAFMWMRGKPTAVALRGLRAIGSVPRQGYPCFVATNLRRSRKARGSRTGDVILLGNSPPTSPVPSWTILEGSLLCLGFEHPWAAGSLLSVVAGRGDLKCNVGSEPWWSLVHRTNVSEASDGGRHSVKATWLRSGVEVKTDSPWHLERGPRVFSNSQSGGAAVGRWSLARPVLTLYSANHLSHGVSILMFSA